MPERGAGRIFVAGGTGFLGYRVVRALLDEAAEITVLVRPGGEDKLGALQGKVQVVEGDVWNPGSLRGRARGHSVVIHLVGGLRPDPARGLTFRHLNFVSARNTVQMAVGDGVSHFILLSASAAPARAGSAYLESKREAERYLRKSGLTWTIVRAPTLYIPGQRHRPLNRLYAALSYVPLLGAPFAFRAPMLADLAARGIASLALSGAAYRNRIVSPRLLRRLGRSLEARYAADSALSDILEDAPGLDEPPFGWLPPA